MKILEKISFFVLSFFIFEGIVSITAVFAASSSQGPFVPEVREVSGGFHFASMGGNHYLVMEKLITEADIEKWRKYGIEEAAIEKQPFYKIPLGIKRLPDTYDRNDPSSVEAYRRATKIRDAYDKLISKWTTVSKDKEGVRAFNATLTLAKDLHTKGDPCDLWIVYSLSSAQEPTQSYQPDSHIEMAFTVTTSPEAPFTTHMGIHRSMNYLIRHGEADIPYPQHSPTYPVHPNLSITLHAFAAKVMLTVDPRKIYMINVPIDSMLFILLRAFSFQDVWVGDNVFARKVNSQELANMRYMLHFYENALGKYKPKEQEYYRPLLEALLNKPSPITRAPKNAEDIGEFGFREKDFEWSLANPQGKIIVDLNANSPNLKDYTWFFEGESRYALRGSPYFIVTLETLASKFKNY